MVLTAIVAATADALAFRSEATLAAVVPSLLLFVFASTLGTTELRTATTIGYSIVALVFLMLQHQALLERHRSWAAAAGSDRRPRSSTRPRSSAGSRCSPASSSRPRSPAPTTAPCSTTAASAARARPGPSSFRTLSPLVDLRARLTDQPDVELFTVEAPHPALLADRRARPLRRARCGASRARPATSARSSAGAARPARSASGSRSPRSTTSGSPRRTSRWPPTSRTRGSCPSPAPSSRPTARSPGSTYRVDSRVAQPADRRRRSTRRSRRRPGRACRRRSSCRTRSRSRCGARARRIVAGARHPVRAGRGAPGLLPRRQLHLRPRRPVGQQLGRDHRLPRAPGAGSASSSPGLRRHGPRGRASPPGSRSGSRPACYDAEPGRVLRARPRRARLARGVARRARAGPSSSRRPPGSEPGQADADRRPAGDASDATAPTTPTTAPTPSTTTGDAAAEPVPARRVRGAGRLAGRREHRELEPALADPRPASPRSRVARRDRLVRRCASRARCAAAPAGAARTDPRALRRRARGRTRSNGSPTRASPRPRRSRRTSRRRATRRAARRPTRPSRSQDLADLYAQAGWSLREPTDEDVARAWSDADSVRDALAEGASGARAGPPRADGSEDAPEPVDELLGARRRSSGPRRRPRCAYASTATNSAIWPRRSASRIWPSSRHAQTRSPSVTSRSPAMSSPEADEVAHRLAHPAEREAGFEQRRDDPQRDEIAEAVLARVVARRARCAPSTTAAPRSTR